MNNYHVFVFVGSHKF